MFKDTLTGRVALVTGAGSGIGLATARLLAFAGARVGLLGSSAEELANAQAAITRQSGESLTLVADVTSAGAMASAMEQLERHWGRLDIVIANAGINGVWAALEDIATDEFDRTLTVNLRGSFLTIKSAEPLLRRNGGGAIVLVSSINGTRVYSHTGATAYSTSKAGQVAMARMLALEFAPHGIRVNTVCPGEIATRLDPDEDPPAPDIIGPTANRSGSVVPLTHGRPGEPRQVAQLIWFLVSDAANHITGTEVYIDGGESLLEG